MKKDSLNNKLVFDKNSVLELNDQQLIDIDGGITPLATTTTFYFVTGAGVSFAISNTIKN